MPERNSRRSPDRARALRLLPARTSHGIVGATRCKARLPTAQRAGAFPRRGSGADDACRKEFPAAVLIEPGHFACCLHAHRTALSAPRAEKLGSPQRSGLIMTASPATNLARLMRRLDDFNRIG